MMHIEVDFKAVQGGVVWPGGKDGVANKPFDEDVAADFLYLLNKSW
jgi:hypothetical protein